MHYRFIYYISLLLLCDGGIISGQIKRSRNEGTFNIPASNVMGNGNITIAAALASTFAPSGVRFDPGAYLAVGIANILQLSGRTAFTNFQTLGTTDAHLQLTMPGNDRLRFFGVSISGDLYLSTEMDTLTGTATTGKPEYHAYIRPSMTVDLDWIAKKKKVPLKTYLMLGMVDNPDLLFLYAQLSVKLGIELKFDRNSYSLDCGTGFYRELQRDESGFAGDPSYLQQRVWLEPAIRFRLFKRYSLLGAVRVLVFQRQKTERPLEPHYVRLSLAFEAPLLYRETGSEAIRSMIFVEKNKVEKPDTIDASINKGKQLTTKNKLSIEGLDIELEDGESEKEMLKRREEIQKKMEEIELLLEDLE